VSKYAVIVERAEDGGYGAWSPDLPGCAALGDTSEQTLQEMRVAVQGHLDVMRERGDSVSLSGTCGLIGKWGAAPMSHDGEDELLVEGLGALGGSPGGRLGARLVAKLLPKNVGQADLVLPMDQDAALSHVLAVLSKYHRVDPPPASDGQVLVRVMASGGYANLNPVVVTVALSESASAGTAVHIRAAAKEGLIKQRAGTKLAEDIRGRLAV